MLQLGRLLRVLCLVVTHAHAYGMTGEPGGGCGGARGGAGRSALSSAGWYQGWGK